MARKEIIDCRECNGTGSVVGYNRDNEAEAYTCEYCGGSGYFEEPDDADA